MSTIRAALAALLLLPIAAIAQVPVSIQNLAPLERRDGWVSFTIPRGTLPATDAGFRLSPFGWPVIAGEQVGTTARLVHVRTGRLGPLEKVRGEIVAAAAAAPPLEEGLVEEALIERPAAAGNPIPELVVQTSAGARTWRPSQLFVSEEGPARTVFHGFGRIDGTPLVANLWLYVYTASRVVPFELFVANSDPRTTERAFYFDGLGLRAIKGVYPAVDFLRVRGGKPGVDQGGVDYVELQSQNWFADAQGLPFAGRLVFWDRARPDELQSLTAATEAPLVGMALNWSGKWGPWGVTPDLQKTENTPERGFGLAAAGELAQRFLGRLGLQGHGFKNPATLYGLNDHTAQTGDAGGFGVTKLAPALATLEGNPFHLWELAPSVFRDYGSRPTSYYEAEGVPLVLERHPNWWTWGLHTHWHWSRSPDRLGKTVRNKNPWNTLSPKDFAHLNSCTGAGWTILTGSHLGRHLAGIEQTAMVRFSELFGEIRAAGRLPLGMVWNHLATGDEAKLTAFARRVWDEWTGLYLKFVDREDLGPVRPIGHWYGKDDRWFGGRIPFWMPWQEGLAINGLDALSQVAPDPRGERALLEACRSYIRFGWRKLDRVGGRYWTFWVVEQKFRELAPRKFEATGEPLTDAQYQDPDHAAPGDGGIYKWGWGAVRISRRRLAASEVPGDAELVKVCDEILAEMRAARASKGTTRGPIRFDRESEWKATR